MGSHGPETPDLSDEIHVLVTGFGPFRDNPINPSFLIAQSLPPLLPPTKHLPTIHIHTHPSPIHVAYTTVRATLPALIFPPSAAAAAAGARPAFDLVLHLGMAPGRRFFTLETLAHRDGYVKPDVDGLTMARDRYWSDEVGGPEVLSPRWRGWSVEDVWRRWKRGVLDEDVRPSRDAGRYLCDFTFYTGLIEYWRRDPGGDLPVVFLHVPEGVEREDVERGERATVALVRALVENRMMKGKAAESDVEVGFEEM